MKIKVFEAGDMLELERIVNNWLSEHDNITIVQIRFQVVEKAFNPYALIILHD